MNFWQEASSVILLARSSNVKNVCRDPFKILCIKRSKINSYLPNYTVFPGGTTEKSDSSSEWTDIIPDCTNSNLNIISYNGTIKFVPDNEQSSIPKCLSLRVTSIRETFEESGILLCKKVNCNKPENCATVNHLEIDSIDRWRKLVQKNTSNSINLCSENNCYPDVGALHLWSNWLTPPLIRTKCDTKCFLAFIESSVNASLDGVETSQTTWNTPDEMLTRFVNGDEKLVTPQYYELLRLRQFTSFTKLTNFACTRSIEGCEQILQMVIVTKEGHLTLLPGDGKFNNSKKYLEVQLFELDKHLQDFDSDVMHRLHHSEEYLPKKIIIKNYIPKCGHVLPATLPDCKI